MDESYNLIADVNGSLQKGSPTSTFSFDPKGNKYLIFRVVVRRDGNPDYKLDATPEDLAKDMVLSSGDPNNFTISKDVALALASSGQSLLFKGYIDGIFRAASTNGEIPKTESKNLTIAFAFHKVTFDKNTGVGGDEIISIIDVVHNNSVTGDELTDQSMPATPVRDGDPDGTEYVFKEWNTMRDGSGTSFTGTSIVNSDMTLYAIWAIKGEEPVVTPLEPVVTPPEPTQPVPIENPPGKDGESQDSTGKAGAVSQTPKTGDESSSAPWILLMLTTGVALVTMKRDVLWNRK